MRPPEQVIGSARRLSLDDFGAEFRRSWRALDHRFLKLECWQAYQEPDARSLHLFLAGDRDNVLSQLRTEAEADHSLYAEVAQRHLDYARIRLTKLPLTRYLQWEVWSYRIRAALGERIVIVPTSPDVALPNEEDFDFLLFDRTTALVHDYGENGLQVGGWLVREPGVLERLERRALQLAAEAEPLPEFLRGLALPWLAGAEAVEGELDDGVGEGGGGWAAAVAGGGGAVPLDE
jgi:hypothetical protein